MNIVSPLKSLGGKSASAKGIIKLFPDPASYDYYVEPCCGACHVILEKPPYHHKEIINDLDDCIINFWRQMLTNADELKELILRHPYSRKLYYDFYHSLYGSKKYKVVPEALTDIERAFRYYYVLRSNITGFIRASCPGWTTLHQATMKNVVETFEFTQSRLARVAIDNRDAIETVRRYSKFKEKVLFYVDPPYFGVENYYPASRDGFDHAGLAAALNETRHYVALSYYPHPEIDKLYPEEKWNRVTWEQHKPSNVQENSEKVDIATELLLTNYESKAKQVTLWDSEAS